VILFQCPVSRYRGADEVLLLHAVAATADTVSTALRTIAEVLRERTRGLADRTALPPTRFSVKLVGASYYMGRCAPTAPPRST